MATDAQLSSAQPRAAIAALDKEIVRGYDLKVEAVWHEQVGAGFSSMSASIVNALRFKG